MKHPLSRLLALAVLVVALLTVLALPTGAATTSTTDFETFSYGSVNYQGPGGTINTGLPGNYTIPDPYGSLWTVADEWGFGLSPTPFDEEVMDDSGNTVWRLSNAVTSGGFSNQPNSPSAPAVAGESTAALWNDRGPLHTPPFPPLDPRASATTPYFHSQFKFKSATGAPQTDLLLSTSAVPRQSTIRSTYLGIRDTGSGFDLEFFDTSPGSSFDLTVVATGLSYTAWHTVDIYVKYVDGLAGGGAGNDIVTVMVNGTVVHTGTTWESFYAENPGSYPNWPYAVDALMFAARNPAVPANNGNGIYFDDVVVDNAPLPPLSTTIKNVHPLGTTTAVPANVCPGLAIDNWYNDWFACDENSANATGGVAAIFGPATPPLGSGSAQFTIGENADGPAALVPFEPGLPLSQLTQATYDTYWDSSDGADDRPNFFINVDYDLTDSFTAWQGRLVWIATGGCPALTADVWQTLDPLGNDACWRQTGTPVVGDSPQAAPWPLTGGPSTTWAAIKAQYPNAGIHTAPLGAIGFKMGSSHNPSVAALDAVTLGVNKGAGEEVTIYNFETPPTVDPVGDTEVCDAGTVNIQIDDVANLYGYEFIVEYDETLVSAVGSFENTWFDPVPSNGYSAPGWNAVCNDTTGECKFAYTRGNPDGELATETPETIASINFTTNPPAAGGTFNVVVKDVKLTDKDSFEIPGAVGGTHTVNVCGEATVSGKISLQGRPQPGRPVISAGSAVFTVELVNGPYGPYTATPNLTDGTFTITGVKYDAGGSTYDLQADHSVYLGAEKSLLVNGNVTGQNTKLLGGDANDDATVDLLDLTCIGGQFGSITAPFTCDTAPDTADVNDDFKVNIQDLSLAAGNYLLTESQGW